MLTLVRTQSSTLAPALTLRFPVTASCPSGKGGRLLGLLARQASAGDAESTVPPSALRTPPPAHGFARLGEGDHGSAPFLALECVVFSHVILWHSFSCLVKYIQCYLGWCPLRHVLRCMCQIVSRSRRDTCYYRMDLSLRLHASALPRAAFNPPKNGVVLSLVFCVLSISALGSNP